MYLVNGSFVSPPEVDPPASRAFSQFLSDFLPRCDVSRVPALRNRRSTGWSYVDSPAWPMIVGIVSELATYCTNRCCARFHCQFRLYRNHTEWYDTALVRVRSHTRTCHPNSNVGDVLNYLQCWSEPPYLSTAFWRHAWLSYATAVASINVWHFV